MKKECNNCRNGMMLIYEYNILYQCIQCNNLFCIYCRQKIIINTPNELYDDLIRNEITQFELCSECSTELLDKNLYCSIF